jgi:hypothetical protein
VTSTRMQAYGRTESFIIYHFSLFIDSKPNDHSLMRNVK